MDYKLLPGIEILSLYLTAFVVTRAVETSCLEAGSPLWKAMGICLNVQTKMQLLG